MRRTLLVLGLLVVAAGCGQSSFVGRRLDNFNAYYNTFYNAQKAFEEGVEPLESATEPIGSDVYLPVFSSHARQPNIRRLEDAIKKSADILRKHPSSKWVDDALLLIGKSYFYLQNYVGAEQKFREIMLLGSKLEEEGRFWLARTLIASGRYNEARDHLLESLNREGLSRRWEPQLRLALAELHVRQESWEEAAVALEEALEGVHDRRLAARGRFLLGQLYEKLGRYDEAVAAFQDVQSYNPPFELLYAAQVNAVRVEGLYGDASRALQWLRRMERDDKNYAYRAELAYLRGRIYQVSKRYAEALNTYHELLYDSDANITDVRGHVHYALGEFYRDVRDDYALAAAHFDTAASALPGTGSRTASAGPAHLRQQSPAPAAVTDADEQARIFGNFARVREEVSRMDSLLYLGSLDEEAFQEVVLELSRKRAEELAAQQRELERRQAQSDFRTGVELDPSMSDQQGKTGTSETGSAGFLMHKDPVRVQEGRLAFVQRWGDRPLVPNWRRVEAIRAFQDQTAGPDGAQSSSLETAGGLALPELDVSAVPRDSLSRAAMRAERAVARYELGNVLFISMNRPDSAAAWYRLVIEEDGDQPVARRAYYALAEVQRALGDTVAAQQLYREIVERYPGTELASRVGEYLGLHAAEASVDSLALAEQAYAAAYDAWQQGAYEQALNELVLLAGRFSGTEVVPKALLAAGSVYLEWVRRDERPLFAELPLSVPDSLLEAAGLSMTKQSTWQAGLRSDTLAAGAPPGGSSVPDERPLPGVPEKRRVQPDPASDEDRPGDVPQKVVDAPASVQKLDDPLLDGEGSEASRSGSPASDSRPGDGDRLADSIASASGGAPDGLADDQAARDPEPVTVETLYRALVTHHPMSPQAGVARRVLEVLEEQRLAEEGGVERDTTASGADTGEHETEVPAEIPDPGVAPPVAEVDTTTARGVEPPVEEKGTDLEGREDVSPDTLETPSEMAPEGEPEETRPPRSSVEADSVGADEGARTPPEPRAEEQGPGAKAPEGAWGVVINSTTSRDEAVQTVLRVRSMLSGAPVRVFRMAEDAGTRYRVVVGPFGEKDDAMEALTRFRASLAADAWVWQVPPAAEEEAVQ